MGARSLGGYLPPPLPFSYAAQVAGARPARAKFFAHTSCFLHSVQPSTSYRVLIYILYICFCARCDARQRGQQHAARPRCTRGRASDVPAPWRPCARRITEREQPVRKNCHPKEDKAANGTDVVLCIDIISICCELLVPVCHGYINCHAVNLRYILYLRVWRQPSHVTTPWLRCPGHRSQRLLGPEILPKTVILGRNSHFWRPG